MRSSPAAGGLEFALEARVAAAVAAAQVVVGVFAEDIEGVADVLRAKH